MELIINRINKSIKVKRDIITSQELISEIVDASTIISHSLRNGGKLFFCGNGGSFADAQHICAEFVSKLIDDRDPLPAITLGVNGSNISAIGNDYGYEQVFSRELCALANAKDVLVAITTSGTSKNVINAIRVAERLSMNLIVLTSVKAPYDLHAKCTIRVPSFETMHIQESHIMIGHIICEIVEQSLKK